MNCCMCFNMALVAMVNDTEVDVNATRLSSDNCPLSENENNSHKESKVRGRIRVESHLCYQHHHIIGIIIIIIISSIISTSTRSDHNIFLDWHNHYMTIPPNTTFRNVCCYFFPPDVDRPPVWLVRHSAEPHAGCPLLRLPHHAVSRGLFCRPLWWQDSLRILGPLPLCVMSTDSNSSLLGLESSCGRSSSSWTHTGIV